MNNIDVLYRLYKPYRITKKNSCIIMNTMEGDYVIKQNPKIDYKKLYNYLHARSFNYVPKIINDSREDALVLEYVEDISIDDNQKAQDLINTISLLNNKTSYFKEVTNDKYKEIYDNLKNNIIYINNYYSELFDKYIQEEFFPPSHYIFLRNYSLINNACNYCKENLEIWFNKVSDKNKQRVAIVHNNLRLDHYIRNNSDYLISWDNYTIDNPVLDLYKLYQNEWSNISFKELYNTYNSSFELLEEEKILLDILISIPFEVDITNNELTNCRNYRKLINYLNKSSKIVLNN